MPALRTDTDVVGMGNRYRCPDSI